MNAIEIVSGEGTEGTRETYAGKRTARAINARLRKERCNGDRWAFALLDGFRYTNVSDVLLRIHGCVDIAE